MNDLLSDSFVGDAKSQQHQDIEMGIQVPKSNAEKGMEAFNKQVEDIEKQVDKVSALLKKLEDANEESKSVTKASLMKAIKKRMEGYANEVIKTARNVKEKLEAMDRDNLTNRQKTGCEKGSAIDRARMNITHALTNRFKDLLKEFQHLRQKIQHEYREVVERRVITVTGTKPDEETIDKLIETGKSEQIFQKAIQETGRGQVLDTLQEIQERHDAVMEIEQRLKDLLQIFNDVAVLVHAQGEIIDTVDNQVKNTMDYVQTGTDSLRTAKNLQKNSRKCMMIAIILLLVIAIIIVLSVLKPWKK